MLLAHDGELADVRALLDELAVPFTERHGRPTLDDDQSAWDLVIATPKRVLELRTEGEGEGPVRVVIVGKETRTLVAMLRRAGVEIMVRRPVHPAALRLLLVHALYRGPEKRRRERVTVGAPVQFRTGIRKRSAVLADFSIRGCRLLSRHAAQRDQSISILLPAELAGGKALKLRGTVVRTGPASGEESGTQAIAATFEAMPRSTVERLQEIVSTYAKGPAVLPEAMAAQLRSASGQKVAKAAGAGSEPKRSSAQTRPVDPRREPDSPAEMPEPADHSAERAGAPPGGSERRTEPRREYPHNVIALGEEATRVLIGRDISMGGMRVDANSWVRVGDELRVALHVRARTEPLVVEARVERDDAEAGLVLQFHNLSDSARDYLNKMVNFLPILAARSEEGGDSGVFVSEILERNGTETEDPSTEAE